MRQVATTAIVLGRIDYGEADRILTMLTPDHGKLRLIAKGVRRVQSKLAGGIELFSVSNITFAHGRGDISTLTSARLSKHFGRIVTDIVRTQAAYDCIKQMNSITEDAAGPEYFALLEHIFCALDDRAVPPTVTATWFDAQVLKLAGRAPNTKSDTHGKALDAAARYGFDLEHMSFTPNPNGRFNANDVKFLRLLLGGVTPAVLARVANAPAFAAKLAPLIQTMRQESGR